jgi:hypothetical protein
LIALAALLPLALPAPAFAGAPASAVPPETETEAAAKLPPLRFRAVDSFLDALAIDEKAARIVDQYWQPATAALMAANPDKAEAARAFAAGQRAAELSLYRPLVAFTLDNRAIELLNPDVERKLAALRETWSAEYNRTRTFSDERIRAHHSQMLKITSGPAARADGQLLALARLALTPDGMALRALNAQGLSYCLFEPRSYTAGAKLAHCAVLEADPALRRLRRSPSGEKLIRLSTEANIALVAMIQMGHAAGISLSSLLPAEELQAAGLEVPPDQSIEELIRTYGTKASRR